MYIFLDDLASFYSTAQYLRISGAVLRHDLHLDVCLVPDGMSQLFQVESTFHGKLDETKQLRWCTTHPWPVWSSSAYQGQVLHSGSATLDTLLFQGFRCGDDVLGFVDALSMTFLQLKLDLPQLDTHVWSNLSLLVPWLSSQYDIWIYVSIKLSCHWRFLAGHWSTRPTWSWSSSIAAPTLRRWLWWTELVEVVDVYAPLAGWILILGDDIPNTLR